MLRSDITQIIIVSKIWGWAWACPHGVFGGQLQTVAEDFLFSQNSAQERFATRM